MSAAPPSQPPETHKQPSKDAKNRWRWLGVGLLVLLLLLSGIGAGLQPTAAPRPSTPEHHPLRSIDGEQTAWGKEQAEPTQRQAQLHLGRQLFRLGLGVEERPIEGRVAGGTVALQGDAVACLRCHGADGEGRSEGGVEAPSLQAQALKNPVKQDYEGGRPPRPAYDRRLLLRAIQEGVDAGGRTLQGVMPRFELLPEEQEGLLMALEQLGQTIPSPAEVLRVGVLLPPVQDERLEQALKSALAHRLSQTAPIFGRTVSLEWILSAERPPVEQGPPAAWHEAPPLALLHLGEELAPGWLDWLEHSGVPVLGSPPEGCPERPLIQQRCIQLLPSLRLQGLLAVERLAQRTPQGRWEMPPVLVVATEGRGQDWLEGVEAGMARLEQPPPWVVRWDGKGPLETVKAEVLRVKPRWILFEGELDGLRKLSASLGALKAAEQGGLGIFWSGTVPEGAGNVGPFELPVVFHWAGGLAEETLTRGRAWISAQVGLALVLEGLRGAGAQVTAGRLVGALEQLRRFPVPEGEPVTLGARRHQAWRGGWLLGWKAASGASALEGSAPPARVASWLEATGE